MTSHKATRKPWSAEEDASLLDLISTRCAVGCWPQIGLLMDSRTGKQCRERYINHLDPDVKRSAWMKCEDRTLRTLYLEHGTKWSLYMPHLSGRSDNAIKNRYHVISRYAEEVEIVHKRSFCDISGDEEAVLLVPILLCSDAAVKRLKRLHSALDFVAQKIRELEEPYLLKVIEVASEIASVEAIVIDEGILALKLKADCEELQFLWGDIEGANFEELQFPWGDVEVPSRSVALPLDSFSSDSSDDELFTDNDFDFTC